jgi:hypothetical protein
VSSGVVVGWSGSAASDRALDVAAGFAQRHHWNLEVVLGWDYLDQPGHAFDPHVTAADVRGRLEAAVAPWRARLADVDVAATAELGWPPAVVRAAARDAELLVLGRSADPAASAGPWGPEALLRKVDTTIIWVP